MKNVTLPKLIFISGLLDCICSCSISRNSIGTYRSNDTQSDLPITTLILKPDSTFEYIIKGNLIYDSSFGKFQIWKHKLFLSKIWEKTGQYRWSSIERAPKIFISGQDSIEYQSIFYFGDDKLFAVDFETGKKIKKETGYNERKKYILFGTHYYKKDWYLRRIVSLRSVPPLSMESMKREIFVKFSEVISAMHGIVGCSDRSPFG
jgi:hypothetical protein